MNWMPIANIYEVNCIHTHRLSKRYRVLFIMSGAINLLAALYWICYQKPGKRVRAKTKWANLILFGRRSEISLPAGFLSDWESLKYICSTSFSWGVCTCTCIFIYIASITAPWCRTVMGDNFVFSDKDAHCLLTCSVSKSKTLFICKQQPWFQLRSHVHIPSISAPAEGGGRLVKCQHFNKHFLE